ncbi:MAG: hypothetical protein V1809_11780 [Planctomycetota bacterium]
MRRFIEIMIVAALVVVIFTCERDEKKKYVEGGGVVMGQLTQEYPCTPKRGKSTRVVNYAYQVDGASFKGVAFIDADISVEEGQQVEVVYLKSDPSSSKLLIDCPSYRPKAR